MKKLRNKFKKLSIGGKIWGAFLFLSALAITIFLVCLVGEFIDDAIDWYLDEDTIPFLIWILLIISGISYFFKDKKSVKWIFYISWILALFLFAGLFIDDNDNLRRERERERTGYYEEQHQEWIEACKYCENNYCDVKVRMKCRANGIDLD